MYHMYLFDLPKFQKFKYDMKVSPLVSFNGVTGGEGVDCSGTDRWA